MRDRKISSLVEAVEQRLEEYGAAGNALEAARAAAANAEVELGNARERLDKARHALFEAFPELAPPPSSETPTPDGGFERVESDDPDAFPDFSAGVIQFRERA